ncbi:hypothetical protein C8F01DRAFT_1060595 [Mycena amicta]|nr:hypothetical protein C8F01DRAFT_1060595 [Mycena amicta]
MPVSFTVAPHLASSVKLPENATTGFTPHQFLMTTTARREAPSVGGIIQFGLTGVESESSSDTIQNIIPSSNGFVYTLIKAYNEHHGLVLRPDDVWLAILAQFNAFVNANAELLRASFVAHDDKQNLTIENGPDGVDFADMARRMGELIQKNVLDPGLREWAVPEFSTTTDVDRTAGAVLLMATLKAYFGYTFALRCGIPRVTLEGQREDWVKMLERLEKLKEFGLETTAWYHLLRPVLARFIASFDAPESNAEFWNQIAHYQAGGSGPSYYSGWINAFMVFDDTGKWAGVPLNKEPRTHDTPAEDLSAADFWARYTTPASAQNSNIHGRDRSGAGQLVLDNTPFHKTDSSKIPVGYGALDVNLVIGGVSYPSAMVAGVVGMGAEGEGRDGEGEKEKETLRPVVGWWMYHKLAVEEGKKKKKVPKSWR